MEYLNGLIFVVFCTFFIFSAIISYQDIREHRVTLWIIFGHLIILSILLYLLKCDLWIFPYLMTLVLLLFKDNDFNTINVSDIIYLFMLAEVVVFTSSRLNFAEKFIPLLMLSLTLLFIERKKKDIAFLAFSCALIVVYLMLYIMKIQV